MNNQCFGLINVFWLVPLLSLMDSGLKVVLQVERNLQDQWTNLRESMLAWRVSEIDGQNSGLGRFWSRTCANMRESAFNHAWVPHSAFLPINKFSFLSPSKQSTNDWLTNQLQGSQQVEGRTAGSPNPLGVRDCTWPGCQILRKSQHCFKSQLVWIRCLINDGLLLISHGSKSSGWWF